MLLLPSVDRSHEGVWECAVHHRGLNLTWTTAWIDLKVSLAYASSTYTIASVLSEIQTSSPLSRPFDVISTKEVHSTHLDKVTLFCVKGRRHLFNIVSTGHFSLGTIFSERPKFCPCLPSCTVRTSSLLPAG